VLDFNTGEDIKGLPVWAIALLAVVGALLLLGGVGYGVVRARAFAQKKRNLEAERAMLAPAAAPKSSSP